MSIYVLINVFFFGRGPLEKIEAEPDLFEDLIDFRKSFDVQLLRVIPPLFESSKEEDDVSEIYQCLCT